MTGNSVEKCFVESNVKLEVKLKFKTFSWLENLFSTAFAWNTTTNTACLARYFGISWQQTCNLQTGTESLKPCVTSLLTRFQKEQ